jgi:hypothetical protein
MTRMAGQALRMPMNFSYTQRGPSGWGFYGLPGTPATTMDAIIEGQRTSTLRKGLAGALQPGNQVLFHDNRGREQPVIVTGRRMVDPSMAMELSQTERWTPEFLDWYMRRNGLEGGRMEQLLYRLPQSTPATQAPRIWTFGGARTTPADAQEVIARLAQKHALAGGAVVHGGAPGADQAAGRLIEDPSRLAVYLRGQADLRGPDPVRTGGRVFDATGLSSWQEARRLAAQYEDPYRPGSRDYNARNMVVLLGPQLNAPRERLVVWTPGGQPIGGTGHAIRAAQGLGIEVRNLGNPEVMARALRWLQG